MKSAVGPRVLIIDDLFGREIPGGGTNRERENLCGKFLLIEESSKGAPNRSTLEIPHPVARARFCRGQSPAESAVGSVVENDVGMALEAVRQGWTDAIDKGRAPWAMVLLDLCFYTGPVTEESHRRTAGMPVGRPEDDDPCRYFGLTLLDAIHQEFPDLPVFILSSKARDEVSLEFSRRGALGFIARDDPRGPERLAEALWQQGLLPDATGGVVGFSLPLLLTLREARRAASHRENVLIRGERGAGKEVIADYIHRLGGEERRDPAPEQRSPPQERPFVKVNAAELTQNLFASELFGIEAYTATGVAGSVGLIEVASGGDLFLDEIADMPLDIQAALLRVLQQRQITRVGSRRPREVDVRFVSATNADIDGEVSTFRADLLDRLRLGGTIRLPPLRERRSDIPHLVEKFVREAESQRSGILRREVSAEALEALQRYDWPGNVRELRSVVLDAVSRYPDVEHLVLGHLRIHRPETRLPAGPDRPERADGSDAEVRSLDGLLSTMNAFRFDPMGIGSWAGKLGQLQASCRWLMARHLAACVQATKRRTPDNLDGGIQIHPAVKLLTGDSRITASEAADVIKRLLGPLEHELDGDLEESYRIAVRLRPKSLKRQPMP